jgi:hypothetical protein
MSFRFLGVVPQTTPSGCWEWPGARDRDGYGVKTVNGRQWRVNRLALETVGVDIDHGLVLHHCDNPPCFRPSHLRVGTLLDNMADKVARGRQKNQYKEATQCIRNHPFTPENTYINPTSGSRQCRTCRREDNRRRKQK